ncbi:tyrosine-type recombinase/integrase [Stieleria neptunia]|uniref:tyrosine-type recombinase/integrase n=1 Tax=Stieleria neptunia TaxID=2527979 RepID=UPI0011A9B0E7|nr:tyrosine-type recombinase/integrase [Stieleria neptunia]
MNHTTPEPEAKAIVAHIDLDKAVCTHSLRVTAATEADEGGVPLIAIQKWLGHKDPRKTLRYIRGHEDLDRSPAYIIRYD